MKVRTALRGVVVATILAMLGALLPQLASAAPKGASDRYLIRARSTADYAGLRAKAVQSGARVLRDLPQLGHDGGAGVGGRPQQHRRRPPGGRRGP